MVRKYVLSIEINSQNQSYDVLRDLNEYTFQGLEKGRGYVMYVRASTADSEGPSTRITASTTPSGNVSVFPFFELLLTDAKNRVMIFFSCVTLSKYLAKFQKDTLVSSIFFYSN